MLLELIVLFVAYLALAGAWGYERHLHGRTRNERDAANWWRSRFIRACPSHGGSIEAEAYAERMLDELLSLRDEREHLSGALEGATDGYHEAWKRAVHLEGEVHFLKEEVQDLTDELGNAYMALDAVEQEVIAYEDADAVSFHG